MNVIDDVCQYFKNKQNDFTIYIILTHLFFSLFFVAILLYTTDVKKLLVLLTLGVLTLFTHIIYGSCFLTELEICYQQKITTSDIQLSILNIERNNRNRRLITTINVFAWTLLVFIKMLYLNQ